MTGDAIGRAEPARGPWPRFRPHLTFGLTLLALVALTAYLWRRPGVLYVPSTNGGPPGDVGSSSPRHLVEEA